MKKLLVITLLAFCLSCSKKDDIAPITSIQSSVDSSSLRKTKDVSKVLEKGFWIVDSYVFTDSCKITPFITDPCLLTSKLYFLSSGILNEYYGCDNTVLLDTGTWMVTNNNSVIFLNTINFPNFTFNIVSLEEKKIVVTYTFAGRSARSVLTQHN